MFLIIRKLERLINFTFNLTFALDVNIHDFNYTHDERESNVEYVDKISFYISREREIDSFNPNGGKLSYS